MMLLIPRSAAKAAGWGDLEVYCQVGIFIDKNDVKEVISSCEQSLEY